MSVTLGVVLIPPVVFYLQPLPPGDFGESVSQQRPALNSPLCHFSTTQTASARKEQQNFSVQVVEQLCEDLWLWLGVLLGAGLPVHADTDASRRLVL